MSPRLLSLLFPDGDTQFWFTNEVFAVGDRVIRDGQAWIVTSLGNFNRDGKALAMTLRPDDELQSK
jgi:hypothetical protein